MSFVKGDFLYEGKAKRIFKTDQPQFLWLEFKDSLTAFNALKKGEFSGKGEVNRDVASLIFRYLKSKDVLSHWVEDHGEREMVCQELKIIPLEVVVRNTLAGSTAKRLGFKEGTAMEKPLVEFYYKDDDLADPFISDDQALLLKTVNEQSELDQLKAQALQINEALIHFFKEVGIQLIDFKLEFGKNSQGQILLGDEITPDSCRLWDMKTGEKLDKDRFRRDLGKVDESYRFVLEQIKERWEKEI